MARVRGRTGRKSSGGCGVYDFTRGRNSSKITRKVSSHADHAGMGMWVGVGKDWVGPKAPTAFHNRMRSMRMQMKVMARRVLYGFLLVCWWIPPSHPAYGSENSPWERIEEGLHLGTFDAPKKSEIGDSKITVLKADPNLYSLQAPVCFGTRLEKVHVEGVVPPVPIVGGSERRYVSGGWIHERRLYEELPPLQQPSS